MTLVRGLVVRCSALSNVGWLDLSWSRSGIGGGTAMIEVSLSKDLMVAADSCADKALMGGRELWESHGFY